MNLSELREAVYDRLGVDTDDALLTAPVINRLVNAALRQIGNDAPWPWLQTSRTFPTVVGTGSYAPASDWARTRELRLDGDDPLDEYDKLELDQRYPWASTQGRPDSFCIEGDLILLRPIPDSTYTVVDNYQRREPILGSDSDEPVMPYQYHDAIVEKAAMIGFGRSGETQRALAAQLAYKEIREQMEGGAQSRSTGTKRVIIRPGAHF